MKNAIYYVMISTVVFTWGFDPIVNSFFYKSFSATALSTLTTFVSTILLFIISFKKLKSINKRYFKIAVPICALNSLACVLQKIGLQYTTPANYAFLEQLACVIVPIALFAFTRVRPSLQQIIASVICLTGCFIFSGLGFGNAFSLGIGEILCATAGIMFGVCIAATGVFAKGFDIGIYMFIHMLCYFTVSGGMALALHLIKDGGVSVESFIFATDPIVILLAACYGLFAIGICWLLRTEALRNVNPTFVAVTSPLSAVITGLMSLILGFDRLSVNFTVGALLIIAALFILVIPFRKRKKA